MIETKPWPGHPELEVLPPDAVTVELGMEELLQALANYVCVKRDEAFAGGHAVLQTQSEPPHSLRVRFTYWRTEESKQ